MVFSSVPPNFLDHHNWHHQLQQQQPGHQQGPGGGGGGNSQLPPPPPPPPGGVGGGGGGGEGSIRPGSMVDRARLAKLPLPEPGLNCPRCDSTNTKFCYFNNYSLTQPRHFCKTCRRYWTRGGALRNVPVGGGCRRNKRSKSRSSKSPSTNERSGSQTGPKSTASPSSCSTEMNSHFTQSLQLPFMGTALQSLSHQFGSGGGTISSNLGGFQTQNEMGFQLGSGNSNILSVGGGSENWRLPFLAGFEVPSNLFQYNPSDQGVEGGAVAGGDQIRPNSGVNTEEAPVKVEEARGGLNLSRQLMGSSSENNGSQSQQWVGNSSWTEFSGLNSSSTTHFI